jgi:thiamine-monophosphate kinase
MNEARILSKLERRVLPATGSWVVHGIGDDCAVVRQPGARQDLVFTTDWLLEDVHFRTATHPARAIGHKALARGLSDIAAMGATPRFCLLSLALPPWIDEPWLAQFWSGFLKLASAAKVRLAGGDLARSGKLACDIVVCGSLPKGQALLRSGARAGDLLYVSGKLGGSAAGMESGSLRHLYPRPRLALGRSLLGRASAAMDLSDGLSIDLHRLCLASGVAAVLDHVPVHPAASTRQALHGGEDYELLFSMRPRRKPPRGAFPIGAITAGKPGQVWFRGTPLAPLGYDHFNPPAVIAP